MAKKSKAEPASAASPASISEASPLGVSSPPVGRRATAAERARAAGTGAALPLRLTADSAIDPSTNLRDLIASAYPGEDLIKARALAFHPKVPGRPLAESHLMPGAFQFVFGLPFRVGAYQYTEDDKGNPTNIAIGGSAPLTGYVPASLWTPLRFVEVTEADDDGEP